MIFAFKKHSIKINCFENVHFKNTACYSCIGQLLSLQKYIAVKMHMETKSSNIIAINNKLGESICISDDYLHKTEILQ